MVNTKCNGSTSWVCHNGHCVNVTSLCNGNNDCGDGSDEEAVHCKGAPYRLSALEVAAIVIGCIIGTVVLCCLLGTIIDCFMHVYKYWCSCLHKAYRSRRPLPPETIALRNPNFNPNSGSGEPTVLVVRAVPPTYSTIIVSCDAPVREGRNRVGSSTDLGGDAPEGGCNFENATQLILSPTHNECRVVGPISQRDDDDEDTCKVRDICTQTSQERGNATTGTNRPETIGILVSTPPACERQSSLTRSHSAHSRITEKTPTLEGSLPPSYSSIFLAHDHVSYAVIRPTVRGTGSHLLQNSL